MISIRGQRNVLKQNSMLLSRKRLIQIAKASSSLPFVCPIVDVETFKSGEIAYMLNHGNEDNPVWFQTLGTDETPVLASSHEIVILKEDGTYANKQGSAIDKLEMEQRLPAVVNVYGIDGRLVRTGVARADALRGLPAGIYVIGGKKVANR